MIKKTCTSIVFLALGLAASGCVPLVVTGAATTTGVVAAQERSAGNAVDDAGIKITLNNLYINHDINDLYRNVNIHVSEGRVMLTGAVSKEQTKADAARLAWKARGVHEVIDEIQLVSTQTGVVDFGRDTWISGQIRTRILLEKNVRSINYNVEAVGGVVYLLGIAQDKEELEKVTYIAATTKSVKQVISHVIMKDDPRRRYYLARQDAPASPDNAAPMSGEAPSSGGGQPETMQTKPE